MNSNELIQTADVKAMFEKREQIRTFLVAGMVALNKAMQFEKDAAISTYSNIEHMLRGSHTYLPYEEPEKAVAQLMQAVDAAFWSSLLNRSGIRALMSARRQEELDRQISENKSPAFEPETVASTFADLYANRASMLEEGLVDLFRGLSWDYRTNNPVKLGKKLILNYVLDSFGSAVPRSCSKIDDLMRVLSVYDGKPIPENRHNTLSRVYQAKNDGSWAFETNYFTVKLYKKGSAHLVFKPETQPLLDQCNRVIARHFPGAIAHTDGRKAA
ncbi:MAG: DUF4942 domain-containing protein [Acidithiobacillus sp.]|nr:DUF4942 domain-containing protein [Acidithiobacillus sp.]